MSSALRLASNVVKRSSKGHLVSRALHTSAIRPSSWPVGHPQHDADTTPTQSTAAAGPSKVRPTLSSPPPPPKTIAHLKEMKKDSKPIVCLTAYDLPSALAIRSADIDVCLVGDSLANVALGFSTTQSLTLDAMIHHCQAVMRGLTAPLFASRSTHAMPLVLADMPFGTTFGNIDSAVQNVVRLVRETGIDGVKIEGSHEIVPLVKALTSNGIPVMGHVGLQPQRVASVSGYRVQAKTASEAIELLNTARALEEAGCFSMVLECIPTKIGELLSQKLESLMIGIGAGSKTDGQILVMNDMLGDLTSPLHLFAGISPTTESNSTVAAVTLRQTEAPVAPKFVRNFAAPSSLGALRIHAVNNYTAAVRDRSFPNDETEGYKIKTQEWRALLDMLKTTPS